jgi:hypothetical protein
MNKRLLKKNSEDNFMKLYNKNRVPVELYNAAGAAIIIPPRTTVTVDASFAQNLPKGVIIKK